MLLHTGTRPRGKMGRATYVRARTLLLLLTAHCSLLTGVYGRPFLGASRDLEAGVVVGARAWRVCVCVSASPLRKVPSTLPPPPTHTHTCLHSLV